MDETETPASSADEPNSSEDEFDSTTPPYPSPFGHHSSRPRMAIDCESWNLAVIRRTIELAVLAGCIQDLKWASVPLAEVSLGLYLANAHRLVLLGPSNEGLGRIRNWDKLGDGLNFEAAAHEVVRWLQQKAAYPARPWFEGGESRGCQIFTGLVDPQAQAHESCNVLVVEPKWLEVPK